MGCNALCDEASHWERHLVSSQRWQESSLRYAADGSLHVGTTVTIDGVGDGIAYLRCVNACTHEASWDGVALYKAFSDVYVSDIRPVVSLALTGDGRPRMLALGDDDAGGRNLIYFECNNACADNNNWQLNALISGDSALDIGPGLDLALSNDAPRFVYTADYNVLIASCDTNCASGDATNWRLSTVELSHDIPKDDVIPYHNCTVSAWFLSHPSLAISADDVPRVAYRAQDISGSNTPVDPNHPPCNTGADMTLTRFAQLTNPD